MRLRTDRHDRDAAGMTYVYPVVSRRARGVSVGVNLNTNNACNWRCIYCQVPGLVRGAPSAVNLELLEEELDELLSSILTGDFLERHVPEGSRRLNDVAFSGNGEPTSSPEFAQAIGRVRAVLDRHGAPDSVKVILITNGALVHQPKVELALERFAEARGEAWFKLDSATRAGLAALNDAHTTVERQEQNLLRCASIVPTYVQTMALALDGSPPSEVEQSAYLACLGRVLEAGVSLRGVLLYGLARTSHQPEAERITALGVDWMEAYAERIRGLGLHVELSP